MWLREVSLNGMVKLGMKVSVEFWKKHICSRIREVGKQVWKNGFNDTEREKEYVQMKECPRNERFTDGNVAAVRLMVRGGCLPVRGSDRMTWKYDDDKCRCGLVETEKHVLFECTGMEWRSGQKLGSCSSILGNMLLCLWEYGGTLFKRILMSFCPLVLNMFWRRKT